MGSIVPIASCLMVRSELYNGALNSICSWVNLLSLYWLEALDFFVLFLILFYEQIHLIMDESVLMLYYIDLYEMIHRPYILKFYIIDTFFSLSLTFLSTPFFYMLLHNLESDLFLFFLCKKYFSCYNYMTNISYLDCFFGYR